MNYAIYKKQGAIQFDLGEPRITEDKWREGVVFINIASATGERQYDWNSKIVFALSVDDVGKLLHFFITAGENDSLNLVHDPNKNSTDEGKIVKSMNVWTREGSLGGVMMTLTSKMGEDSIKHKVGLSGHEVVVLKALFEHAIPKLLAWD
jgi:hypothetical protein